MCFKNAPLILVPLLIMSACMSASEHRKDIQDTTDRITVGTVQKEIKIGMTGADVAQALGSPNIVTTDEQRREVWIYDKISTERIISEDNGGTFLLIFNTGGTRGASSSTQKTLTVIVKFDENKHVRDFAYHTSKF